MTMPIIRLEVESMRYTIVTALTQYQAQLDSDIKKAVDLYCTPENIQKVIQDVTFSTLNYVIKEEVEKFFRYGEGRTVIAESVKETLLNRKTYTPLDNV